MATTKIMDPKRFWTGSWKKALLCLLVSVLLFGCGGGGGGSSASSPLNVGPGGGGGGGAQVPAIATVTLAATPASLTVLGTSSIQATVLDNQGANAADGTVVTFTLNNSDFGTVSAQATTFNGVAVATFAAAADTPGTAVITAKAESISAQASITIAAAATSSIEFVSASPQVVGIKGSGQAETSTITFSVKDVNGNPQVDGTSVTFTMTGPGGGKLASAGGEYINDADDTPATASVSTVNGNAIATLHSGAVAGPVTILATVTGTTLSSSSTPLSIGGGVPSATHFTVTTSSFNLPGLAFANRQSNISVFLADRFGNFNVLTGSSISFAAEGGAVNTSATTDATGVATVVYRTQDPDPVQVACAAWETALITQLNTTYSLGLPACSQTTNHPRNGWASILVSVKGEETFSDSNANGIFNSGEPFTDTPQEAFIDKNDDSIRDNGTNDPFEEFIDDNGNGAYNGVNGSWDSSKTIFKNIRILITGGPAFIEASPNTFAIGQGGSQFFTVLIADQNLNPLSPGSTVSVSTTKGTLTGTTAFTFANVFQQGPTELGFALSDAAPTDTDPAEAATITVTVTWEGVVSTTTINGTIN